MTETAKINAVVKDTIVNEAPKAEEKVQKVVSDKTTEKVETAKFKVTDGCKMEDFVLQFLPHLIIGEKEVVYVEDGYILRKVARDKIEKDLKLDSVQDGKYNYRNSKDNNMCFFEEVQPKKRVIDFPNKSNPNTSITINLG